MNNHEKPSRSNRFFPLYRRPSLYSIPDESSTCVGVFPKPRPLNDVIKEKRISAVLGESSNTGLAEEGVIHNIIYTRLLESLMEENDFVADLPETEEKSGNIILDMDGTLGDHISATFPENPERFSHGFPIPRPGLKKFFAFVFSRYERVSIWTAASPDWYFLFKEKVLLPNMPPGSAFHFERTRNLNVPYVYLKPLSEIYAKYPGEYNESNTTIVDDNVETFRDNRANAVHITPFFYNGFGGSPETRRKNAAKDRGLYVVMEILTERRNRISSKI